MIYVQYLLSNLNLIFNLRHTVIYDPIITLYCYAYKTEEM